MCVASFIEVLADAKWCNIVVNTGCSLTNEKVNNNRNIGGQIYFIQYFYINQFVSKIWLKSFFIYSSLLKCIKKWVVLLELDSKITTFYFIVFLCRFGRLF